MIKPGQIIGKRQGGDPKEEQEHFYICKQCGQAVDKRDLGKVMHHERPNHRPLSRRLMAAGIANNDKAPVDDGRGFHSVDGVLV